MDFKQIEKDANEAYWKMNLSAAEYIDMMNKVGATFAQTMGDQKGYDVAKRGLQAISDYASGTGADINLLNDKYKMITRSTSTYLSIADQFAGILPQTTKDFLEQAQASGFLAKSYKKLTDVPVAEYQEAVTKMIEKGVDSMGLLGNTALESTQTLTGSIAMMKKSWQNFLSGTGGLDAVVKSTEIAFKKIIEIAQEVIPEMARQLRDNLPQLVSMGKELFGVIAEGIMIVLPDLMSTAGEIIMAIIDGIIAVMPQVVDTAMLIVDRFADGLLNNSDRLGEVSAKLIMVMGKGLIDSIPHLIQATGKMLDAMVLAITKANGDLWVAGFEAFMNFIDGVKATIDRIRNIATLIKNIIKLAINELKSSAYSWGVDFLSNFANGIMSRIHQLSEAVSNVANRIRSKLHFSRPDEGPLRDYESWMPDMIKGMAKSLNGAMPILDKEINKLTSQMAWGLSPTLNAGAYSYSPSVNVDVHNNMTMDPLGQMVNQVKTFSNGAKNDYNYGYGG